MSPTSYWRTRLPGKTHDEKVSIIADAIVKIISDQPEDKIKKRKLVSLLGFSYSSLVGEKCFPKLALDKLIDDGKAACADGSIWLTEDGKRYHDSHLESTPTDFYPVNTTGPMGKVLPALKRLFRARYPHVADIFDCSNVSVNPDEVHIEMINPPAVLMKVDNAFLVTTLEKTIHATYGKKVKVDTRTVTLKKAESSPMPEKEPVKAKSPLSLQVGPMGQIILLMRDLLGENDFSSCTTFTLSNEDYSFSFYKLKRKDERTT